MKKKMMAIIALGLILSGCVGEKTIQSYNNSIDTAKTLQGITEERTGEFELEKDEVPLP